MKKRNDIEKLVLVKLEEYTPFGPDNADIGPLLGGADSLSEVKPIYDYIKANISDAANEILRVVPLALLCPMEYEDHCHIDELRPTTGTIELPDDFLRLHTLLMHGWMRPVHKALSVGEKGYDDQEYPATAGNYWKPVAILDSDDIVRCLHYYSVKSPKCHKIKKLLYIPDYLHTSDFDDSVAELIALNCAKKVYEIFGNTEQVNLIVAEVKAKLENMLL